MSRSALVVGIDNYENNINSLEGSVFDAIRVSKLLERHWDERRNFDVMLLTAPDTPDEKRAVNRVELTNAIDQLFSKNHEIALLYFAGHGHVDKSDGYILTSDSQKGDGGSGVPFERILDAADKSKAKNKIIILDSCYAGSAGADSPDENKSELSLGLTILASSAANEEAKERRGGGVYTNLLVDALKGEARNLMGDITPGSVYAHIDQSLGTWSQRPVFKTNVENFVSLRQVEPPISHADLLKIVEYFPEEHLLGEEFHHPLNKTYEPDSGVADPEKTAIFRVLQRYNRVNLVIPHEEDHMYYAAMNEKSCKLTSLGKHYRKLVANGRI